MNSKLMNMYTFIFIYIQIVLQTFYIIRYDDMIILSIVLRVIAMRLNNS